jgi:hypothetical protein
MLDLEILRSSHMLYMRAGFSPEEIVRVALLIPHHKNICIFVVIFSFFQPHQREFGPLRVTFGLHTVVSTSLSSFRENPGGPPAVCSQLTSITKAILLKMH